MYVYEITTFRTAEHARAWLHNRRNPQAAHGLVSLGTVIQGFGTVTRTAVYITQSAVSYHQDAYLCVPLTLLVDHNYTFVLHQERTLSLGSDERIGVTACISGLKTLARNLHSRLSITPTSQLPVAAELLSFLETSISLLKTFENHFRPGTQIPIERASLVQVDQLVACFSSAVLLFNNIQQAIRSIEAHKLATPGDLRHESTLRPHAEKLANQCQIWQTLLNLLQWFVTTLPVTSAGALTHVQM